MLLNSLYNLLEKNHDIFLYWPAQCMFANVRWFAADFADDYNESSCHVLLLVLLSSATLLGQDRGEPKILDKGVFLQADTENIAYIPL